MSDAWLVDAAVRASFDPHLLPNRPGEDLHDLARQRRDGTWILPDSMRCDVIAASSLDQLRAALGHVEPTIDATDPTQRLLRRLIVANTYPLDDWSVDELRVGRRVVRWLSGLRELADLPSQELVTGRYERETLLAPLRRAVRQFEGRMQQFEMLMNHVEGDASASTLIVTGVGGSGKTALLSKVVVDLADRRIKVAYLDLDRADLDLTRADVAEGLESRVADHRPGLLAAEIARQVAVLAGDASDSWLRAVLELRREWMNGAPFGAQIATMLNDLGGGPLVVVLDTFEEAQYERASGAVHAVQRMLKNLQAVYPPTRVVIGSRAPVPELDAPCMRLSDLDDHAAARVLQATASPTPLTEQEATAIVAHVGGNPLWVVVAGQAVAKDPLAVHTLGKLRGEAAAAFLYRRVLDHVHDVPHPELIEPSLHLRILRPELLHDVIAPVLNIQLTLDECRQHLMHLTQEVALVTSGDSFIRHRPEVRALTLVGLRDGAPGRWAKIHCAAKAWWTRHAESQADHAEAAYHALNRISLIQIHL